MTPSLSREFDLVAACCRWPRGSRRQAAVAAAAAPPLDWQSVRRLAARHRVTALVQDGLRDAEVAVPPDIAEGLRIAARDAGLNALSMAREAMRLQSAFDAAGLQALFVKGTTLALLAYGEIGIKQSWDIDLLTVPGQALAGRHLLERNGYSLFQPAVDDTAFLRYVAVAKEAIFHNPELGISVELHWRLLDTGDERLQIDAVGARQNVRLNDADIRTLADEALYTYLCMHGTIHAWFRLKWLADLAAFIVRRSPGEIARLHAFAAAKGAGRPSAVALQLCHTLLGVPLPQSLHHAERQDRLARILFRNAIYCLSQEADFPLYSQPGLRTQLSHLLVGGWAEFKLVLGHKWVSVSDRVWLPLPPGLAFLYGVLRVPAFLWRRVSELARGAR